VSQDLKSLSDLLDEALDLSEADSEAMLARLDQLQPALAPTLRRLLQFRPQLETDELLTPRGHVFNAKNAAEYLRETTTNPSALHHPAIGSALVPGTHIGPYRLERCLGEGGMASVWLAARDDATLKRTVALKLLHAWRHTADVVERFRRERDILAQLSHPNIARLFDAGVTDSGIPWIALEYVDGAPITHYADVHRLSVRQRITLVLDVMNAVQYAHQSFVVHRDIKPSNVLVDASGRVRLLDFGIAKIIADDGIDASGGRATALTEASGRALTLRYAAPEQITAGPITAGTDVYALGLVLAELLTGDVPRATAKDATHALALADATITRPSRARISDDALRARASATPAQLQAELRGDLDTIILKSLARDPQRRYATVNAFSEDLHAWMARRPIRARAPSVGYRTQMFFSRHRWPIAGIATVFAVTSIAIGTSWRSHEALKEQRAHGERLQTFMGSLFFESESSGSGDGEIFSAKALFDRGLERANSEYADQPAFRGELMYQLGTAYLRIGETKTGMDVLRESIALLEPYSPSDGITLNKARTQLGGMLLYGAERTQGVGLLERVLRDCNNGSEACDSVLGNAHLHLAHDSLRGPDRTREHIEQALRLYRMPKASNSVDALQVLVTAADLARARGDLVSAKQWLSGAEAIAKENPPKDKERMLLTNTSAAIALDDGHFAQAAQIVDALISGPLINDQSGILGTLYALRARIALWQGLLSDALEFTDTARKVTDRQQSSIPHAIIELYEARIFSMTGQHDRARQRVKEAWATLAVVGVTERSEMWYFARRIDAETLARRGEYVLARAHLMDTLNQLRAAPLANPQQLVHILDTLGAVSTASGLASEAITLHREELAILGHSVAREHPLSLRAALQLSMATQAFTGNSVAETQVLARLVLQALPPESHYRQSLLAPAEGSIDVSRAFLLF
jgi:eukaryotic-like serine/threonine-protein kinase